MKKIFDCRAMTPVDAMSCQSTDCMAASGARRLEGVVGTP